jgi:hypothetical protein
MYLIIKKIMHPKPTVNIKLNLCEKLKKFPLKSEMRNRWSPSLFSFNIVLEYLVRAIKQEKDIRGIKTRKEVVKSSLFEDSNSLYNFNFLFISIYSWHRWIHCDNSKWPYIIHWLDYLQLEQLQLVY